MNHALEHLHRAFDSSKSALSQRESRVYQMVGENWPNGVVLKEQFFLSQEDIELNVTALLTEMTKISNCLTTVCMYVCTMQPSGSTETFLHRRLRRKLMLSALRVVIP
ncbi:hypothetical protein VARIO8X_110083 [Burkholderiales bacterium 8X]|nr:hypothetical protein VARIO8X_110083 [Burkholderiales bacterium 8X]